MKAYMDVRDDNSPTMWAVFKYEGNKVVLTKTGIDYPEFLSYLARIPPPPPKKRRKK